MNFLYSVNKKLIWCLQEVAPKKRNIGKSRDLKETCECLRTSKSVIKREERTLNNLLAYYT